MSVSDDVISALVPSREECRRKAEQLRRAYPGLSDRELAERAISTAKRWASTVGAAGGAVANPLAMVPAAGAEMIYMLRAEGRLAGTIGALFDEQALGDDEGFTGDVLAILFPGAVSQALAQVGVRAGQATTRTLIRKYISKEVLRKIIKYAAKYLGLKLTQKAILSKMVPLVGSAIGATWNWAEVRAIGRRAINHYGAEP